MSNDNNILDKLIQLSKTFKDGYTIQINDNKITQFDNKQYHYIVSYKTIIKINMSKTNNNIYFCVIKNLDKKLRFCFIGGWLNRENNIYYIEFNRIFSNKQHALKIAKRYKQKYIYDSNNRELITV